MKIFDLIKISAKNLKGRWAVLPAAGIAICVFCLCFSGAILMSVQKEKSLPYELNCTPVSANISDSVIAQISQMAEVTAVTPVIDIPAGIKADKYSVTLTATGIYAEYLNGEFELGGVFDKSSNMPNIILNEAACRQFSENDSEEIINLQEDAPKIDWLNANVVMAAGEGVRPSVSRIIGILADEEDEQAPIAYISISSAKELLRQSGQAAGYTGAYVRIKNVGCADSVTRQISALGINVNNPNELQPVWDMQIKEMSYLIAIGVFGLLCSIVLMAAWKKISLMEQKSAYNILRWMGMKDKEIGRIFIVQSIMISLMGIAAGILVSTSLPSFLSLEISETSIFKLQIPFEVAALIGAACIIAGILPLLNIKKNISSFLS